jgi:hypothetical protein
LLPRDEPGLPYIYTFGIDRDRELPGRREAAGTIAKVNIGPVNWGSYSGEALERAMANLLLQ